MSVKILRLVVGIVVILAAWAVGNLQGQARTSEFLIKIRAPEGETFLVCERGCSWTQTSFKCSNSGNGLCGSAYDQNGFTRTIGGTTPGPRQSANSN